MYLDVEGGANLSKRAETALNMCAPGVCRETQVLESISKKIHIKLFLSKWSLSSIVISYLLVIQEFGLKNLHCNNAFFLRHRFYGL